MDALPLIEVFSHRRVFSRERLESFLSARIRQASRVEYEAAAIAALVSGKSTLMVGETEDAHGERRRCLCAAFVRCGPFPFHHRSQPAPLLPPHPPVAT